MQCAHGVHDIPGFLGGKPGFFAAGLLAVQEIAAAGLTAPRPWLPAPRHLGPCLVGWPMGPFLQGRGEVRYSRLAPASSVRVVSSAPQASAPPCGRRTRHSPSAHRRCRRGPSAPPGLRPLFYTQFHVVGTTSFALEILILKFFEGPKFLVIAKISGNQIFIPIADVRNKEIKVAC